MNRFNLLLFLIVMLSSCKSNPQVDNIKRCHSLKELALAEIDKGNLLPLINTKYIISNKERFYIWKKYKINVKRPFHTGDFYQIELDSCYNSVMLANTPALDKIANDLDSLTTNKPDSEYDYPTSRYIKKYHDGKYDVSLDANEKRFAPSRIDSNYYQQLEAFQSLYNPYLTDTLLCEFWYEIDTIGLVTNFEIYHHSTPELDLAVTKFYSSFNYRPANDGTRTIEFRGLDKVHFLGTKKIVQSTSSLPRPSD